MPRVMNEAMEAVFVGSSDAECVRWWQEFGRSGDYLEDTGEPMSEVAIILGLDDGEELASL